MGTSEINGYSIILIISLMLLAVNVSAETTFFGNPDDAFIMDDFATTGGVVIVERTGGATSRGACTYQWDCTDWGKCLPSGKQTRNCINVGTCHDTYEPPEMEQDCTYTAFPEVGEEHEEPGNETKEQNETGKMGENGIVDENMVFFYSLITTLAIGILGSIIFYSRKGYFGKPIKRTTATGIIKSKDKRHGKKIAGPRHPPTRRNREVPAMGGPMDVRQKAGKNQILIFLISNSRYPTDSVSIIKDVTKVISRPVYVTVNKPYYALIKTLEGEGIDTQGFYFVDASSGDPDDESKSKGENFEKIESANMTDIMLTIEKCLQTKRFDGVIFDSISTLLTRHDEEMVIRFTHSLINKLRKNNVKGIFMCTKEDMNTSLMNNLNMLADSSVDTERRDRK